MVKLTELKDLPVKLDGVSLSTIAARKMEKDFPEAVEKVVRNVYDRSMPLAAKRQIVITLDFVPSEDQSEMMVDVKVETKLPNPRAKSTKLYMVQGPDDIIVSESNPDNPGLKFS